MGIPTSLSLARIRGTAVRLHLLSILTVGWYALVHAAGDVDVLVRLGGLVGALFVHELGHHLAARLLAVRVERTMLFPFGGVALLVEKPEPRKERAYHLAGPLANLLVLLCLASIHDSFVGFDSTAVGVLQELSLWNTFIGVINLLPIQPLDGGAIVDVERRRQGRRAPRSIARVWIPLTCLGLFWFGWSLADPVPVAAAIGIAASAAHGAARERTEALVGDSPVGSIMIPVADLAALPHGATVAGSIGTVIRSTDTVFVVSHNDTPLGFAFRNDIVDAAVAGGQRYLAELIDRELTTVEESSPLEDVLERIGVDLTDPLVIGRSGEIRGLVFREQIVEFMLLCNAGRDDESSPFTNRSC